MREKFSLIQHGNWNLFIAVVYLLNVVFAMALLFDSDAWFADIWAVADRSFSAPAAPPEVNPSELLQRPGLQDAIAVDLVQG